MKLIKNNRYSYKVGRRIRAGKYLGKYFNKAMKQWHYKFELFVGMYHTPLIVETKVVMFPVGAE